MGVSNRRGGLASTLVLIVYESYSSGGDSIVDEHVLRLYVNSETRVPFLPPKPTLFRQPLNHRDMSEDGSEDFSR
jgi:hypothetical protein